MLQRHLLPVARVTRMGTGGLTRRLGLLLLLLGGIALLGHGLGVGPAAGWASAQCGPPSMTVSASPSSITAGQSVTFTYAAVADPACASPPLPTMRINFGDGTAPLPLNAPVGTTAHTYSVGGTYSVLVTATSAGRTGQARTVVTVTPVAQVQPVLSLAASPQAIAAGQNVDFIGQLVASTPGAIPIGVTIDFGDGQSAAPVATRQGIFASHTYAFPGAYTATLTVTDTSGRVGQATTLVAVTPGVQRYVVTLRASPLSVRAGDLVDFLGQVVASDPGSVTTSATIDFGDGEIATPQTTGAGFIAQHAYTRVGTYTAILAVTDTTGQTARASVNITVVARTIAWP